MSLENLHSGYNVLTDLGVAPDLETSPIVRHIAGQGLRDPNSLSPYQVQQICGSVLPHLEKANNPLAKALMADKP